MARSTHSNPEVQAVLDGFLAVAAAFDRRVKLAELRLRQIEAEAERRNPRQ